MLEDRIVDTDFTHRSYLGAQEWQNVINLIYRLYREPKVLKNNPEQRDSLFPTLFYAACEKTRAYTIEDFIANTPNNYYQTFFNNYHLWVTPKWSDFGWRMLGTTEQENPPLDYRGIRELKKRFLLPDQYDFDNFTSPQDIHDHLTYWAQKDF